MKTVYKFVFEVEDEFVLSLPEGAQILKVDRQGDQPTMWILVDPSAPVQTKTFLVRGTGHPVPETAQYVATFFDGPFVWHLFERRA